jgi:predicted nucleic acid-binding Zn ribbon protein
MEPIRHHWCGIHNHSGPGRCVQCAAAAQQRDINDTVLSRLDDMYAELVQLRRRVVALEHCLHDGQRAHNVLADWTDVVEQHLRALLAELERGSR